MKFRLQKLSSVHATDQIQLMQSSSAIARGKVDKHSLGAWRSINVPGALTLFFQPRNSGSGITKLSWTWVKLAYS